ncbi:MAG: hypothetical protein AAGA62_19940, partial [Bacteroidota bacterium]
LTQMWIYVRNIMNIAFVGMILVVAAVNLVTAGQSSNWSIKAKLGPIILGLVAINFSMLAIRVLVDAVNVGWRPKTKNMQLARPSCSTSFTTPYAPSHGS